ncbi:hypothetical protein B0T20DRAFT_403592 [Sordaria brevicollis]|uniref:Peptidase S54 rhomboid domain-containing protein n=1 Tax=Sordaria brevicollis TaxID=83679 RepID=A0AAE0PLM4_SORBR|nr:hypothetical protein B0T20DRAFT_403592 [Sordaria brevicollis]
MSDLLSKATLERVDRIIAQAPFTFCPDFLLFNEQWRRSPFLGRFLISNFKKGWFVYVFCGVNVAVFALWHCPSLLELPSKLRSFIRSASPQQAKNSSGRGGSTRVPPKKRVVTIHDLPRAPISSNRTASGASLFGQPAHWKTLYQHFTHSLDNLAQGRWWTMVTGAISHNELEHIGKNLVAFVCLASIAIDCGVSNGQLIWISLGSAVAGGAAQLWHNSRLLENDRLLRARGVYVSYRALGASGIVSGLSVAVALCSPDSLVQLSVPFLRRPPTVPVWTLPVFSCAWDMWMLNDPSSRIAHHAHLGGALFGGLYAFIARRGHY